MKADLFAIQRWRKARSAPPKNEASAIGVCYPYGVQRIVVNTDPGVDDAMALLYLLNSSDIRLEAIIASYGNVPVEVATRNVFEVLRVARAKSVPQVARGADSPLRGIREVADAASSENGLGTWATGSELTPGMVSEFTASDLIPSLAQQHPNDVTLVTIAPMTSAALALRKNPVGFRMIKEIIMMGGAVYAPGNITATAEFNVFLDPIALREILMCGVSVVLVGLDVTQNATLTPRLLDEWLGGRADLRAQFLRCLCEYEFSRSLRTTGLEGLYLHDPLTVAIALDKSLARTRKMKIDVEISGEITTGTLVAERRSWMKGGENVEVCLEVNVERFLKEFRRRVFSVAD